MIKAEVRAIPSQKKKKKKKWEAAQAKECSGFWRWKDKKPPPELMEGASLLTFDCNTQD